MSFEQISLDKQEGIALLTLNRPDRMNAFTTQMMLDIVAALDECDADDAVRAVIFTGAGERAYCAGADLGGGAATFDYDKRTDKAVALPDGVAPTPVRADGSIDWSHPLVRDSGGRVSLRIFEAKKPVLGAINGAAVGIGATMTLPMDARLASDTARYGFVFARRGIVPEAASSWFLPRLVGIANAVDLCYSGRLISAEEARDKGLVQSVHAPGELIDAAIAKAREMTEHSAPVSVALTRHMLWRMLGAPHPMSAHRWDSRAIYSRGRSPDAAEGVTSFLEKRAPDFTASVAEDYPWFDEFEDAPPYS
ncbi:crotonase/enoyl-CoA hydratase family protein [Sphingopyxis sp. XHP0097]|uniref:Crotonase/enoyl-CoA hydratase family protein n=1 Tax=Sphingopyxis jiangsuensis TaxID=2871171 RepID=A0ABS7M9Z8_9SPHN|nr:MULTISPECIES: crotonase/enoyl-CoA hydratase family protein [Sphingopyxis]MBL0768438.1 crotonase/enoyl-CoA hydratase family protein [Sphingopyxis lutea]MBY4635847.1 crotonase/enoyl-CoA hydratase family protein [Sphingopyxis jiangsuensis]